MFTNLELTKLMNMNIQDIRRENLRRWTQAHGVPQEEKSFFSQILGGSSFGERAARRLERDYKMGDGFLDKQDSKQLALVAESAKPPAAEGPVESDDIIELITLFQQSSQKGRQFILKSARAADKGLPTRWIRVNNES